MKENLLHILSDIMDPEIPVLSIVDLGILQDVVMNGNEVEVIVTPTYSGCPAMDTIRQEIRIQLAKNGYGQVRIRTVLSPAWTTDWITAAGKEKLRSYGIAAPCATGGCGHLPLSAQPVQCPHCNSSNTSMISEFGSTACKALYRCNECLEPFDYFKCH
jgi:ring-1,2-phenylacetyl-CoA epoxidase subunit PaaD